MNEKTVFKKDGVHCRSVIVELWDCKCDICEEEKRCLTMDGSEEEYRQRLSLPRMH